MTFCVSNDLQEASYRGVTFMVRSDKENYGRRIVTHQYMRRDEHTNEDLGEQAQTFNVVGYVFGDSARGWKDSLVSACRVEGPALLQLPATRAFMAVCNSCSVSRSRDEQGIFEITMQFTAEPMGPPTLLPAPYYGGLISGILSDALVPALQIMFASNYNSSNVLQYVVDNAQMRMLGFAGLVIETLENAPTLQDSVAASKVVTTAIGLSQNVTALVQPEPTDPPAQYVVSQIAEIMQNGVSALPPEDAQVMFERLAEYTLLEPLGLHGAPSYGERGLLPMSIISGQVIEINGITYNVTPSTSERADVANALVFNGSVRVLSLAALAQVCATRSWASRRDAIRVRANLVELFERELQRTQEEAVVSGLLDARDNAVRAMTQAIIDLAPVITVSANKNMPALYWANRLYADATRALELADRNSVSNPMFMPQAFEANNK